MTNTEEYFFDNNITIYKARYSPNVTWFSTDDGQYVENFERKLFKENTEGKWIEIKKTDAATSAIN